MLLTVKDNLLSVVVNSVLYRRVVLVQLENNHNSICLKAVHFRDYVVVASVDTDVLMNHSLMYRSVLHRLWS